MLQNERIADAKHLDLVLFPHRSLKPEHFTKLLIGLIILCTLGGIRFAIAGAWPVTAFLFVDLLALWFAFYLNYRRARIREVITLTDTILTVQRTHPGGTIDSWRFEPYWVQLALNKDARAHNRLELSLHDQRVHLGVFLTPAERKALYKKLSTALLEWKSH